jgi:hypothetical protein
VRKTVTISRKQYFLEAAEAAEAELADEEHPPPLRGRAFSVSTRLDLFFLSLLLIAAASGLFVLLFLFLIKIIMTV